MALRGKVGESWSPPELREQLSTKIGPSVPGRGYRTSSTTAGHGTLSKILEKWTLDLEGDDGPRLQASNYQAVLPWLS